MAWRRPSSIEKIRAADARYRRWSTLQAVSDVPLKNQFSSK
jgi:hypothetical protein